ncbi:L-histidine N(alpha)-methyltransferase [uncultured Tateyamaria sp.]|uniref:L-histidine N(alpha)-methyltransferase n=1 Tax=uncultured Tateyamaria sp. TaxID=455651 RepID=UPI0026220328|nr:L-histidine N(alpha)-methyltransferase [uncultured Tateyamaria sp.]
MAKDSVEPINSALLADALAGLAQPQKQLSPKWFYDTRGSELFEEITQLDEYYPTRTEAAILVAHADQLARLVPPGGVLVELGSGASVKTRTLLDAGGHFGAYVPIDIAEEFLMHTAQDLRRRYPDLNVAPVVADFTSAITLPSTFDGVPKTAFFPGSTIGNLAPQAAIDLLSRMHDLDGVDTFVLGVDLVKDRDELIRAYDDRAGVTAAFNLNILERLNREAGADFDLESFAHEARWIEDRIEMHLVSRRTQSVALGGIVIHFQAGESIHTESCRKYTQDSLRALADAAGWVVDDMFADSDWRFMVAVLKRKPD